MISFEVLDSIELVEISIPDEYSFLPFLFGAVFLLNLLVAFFLYSGANRRRMNGLFWSGVPTLVMAIFITVGIVTGSLVAWVALSIAGLVTPLVFFAIYFSCRARGKGKECPSCGRPMEANWTYCPYCFSQTGETGCLGSEPVPIFVPPSEMASREKEEKRVPTRRGAIEHERTVLGNELEEEVGAGWLVVREGQGVGKEYRVTQDVTTIGRASNNDVTIPDEEVSRFHAEVRYERGEYYLLDLESSNGTYVNGELIQAMLIEDDDFIRLGKTELVFKKI